MLSFFPLDDLDEIWDLTESVSEGFLTYSTYALSKLTDKKVKLKQCLSFIYNKSQQHERR